MLGDYFTSDMLSASKWKGQLYGLPIWGGTYAEIYNRDCIADFRAAGVDPADMPDIWAGAKALSPDQAVQLVYRVFKT